MKTRAIAIAGCCLMTVTVACSSSSSGGPAAGDAGAGGAGGAGGGGAGGSDAGSVDLSCVGTAWPAPATAHDMAVHLTVVNFLTAAVVTGATVKVCAHADELCTAPLAQGTTKSDGSVDLTKVPAAAGGTDAYLEISKAGVLTSLFYPHQLGGDLGSISVRVLDTATVKVFLQLLGAAPPPDAGSTGDGGGVQNGFIVINPQSCTNDDLAGATVDSSNKGSAAVAAYIAKGAPSTTATKTDSSGIGVFVNHTPGKTTVSAKLGAQTLASTDVWVRPGVLTEVWLPPGK